MKKIRTAMVLAAGLGNRMQELTRDIPKPLLKIGNLTLLDIQLIKLKNAGIKKVIINLHHFPEKIIAHIEKNSHSGLDIHYSREPELLGTGGGIARAEHFFGDEAVLFINSDILSDLSLRKLLHFYYKSPSIATITVWPSGDFINYSLVKYSPNHHLTGFQKKEEPAVSETPTGIFMGYYILSQTAREYLIPRRSSVVTTFFVKALQQNKTIPVYIHNGRWVDIGTRENYQRVLKDRQSGVIDLQEFFL